jgi:hypothetical protein
MLGLTATQRAEGKLTGLARLQVKVKQDRSLRFSYLLHPITPEMMEKAYKSLNRQSARGGDQRLISSELSLKARSTTPHLMEGINQGNKSFYTQCQYSPPIPRNAITCLTSL